MRIVVVNVVLGGLSLRSAVDGGSDMVTSWDCGMRDRAMSSIPSLASRPRMSISRSYVVQREARRSKTIELFRGLFRASIKLSVARPVPQPKSMIRSGCFDPELLGGTNFIEESKRGKSCVER